MSTIAVPNNTVLCTLNVLATVVEEELETVVKVSTSLPRLEIPPELF